MNQTFSRSMIALDHIKILSVIYNVITRYNKFRSVRKSFTSLIVSAYQNAIRYLPKDKTTLALDELRALIQTLSFFHRTFVLRNDNVRRILENNPYPKIPTLSLTSWFAFLLSIHLHKNERCIQVLGIQYATGKYIHRPAWLRLYRDPVTKDSYGQD